MLLVSEHASAQYAPRTWHNAQAADATVAFAVRFDTAGERLTRRAAADRYLHAELAADPDTVATELIVGLRQRGARSINVAGNGMQRLAAAGWSQQRANEWVYAVLQRVHSEIGLCRIVCGGQTGVDLAGAAAGVALGIRTEVMMPKGFLQRSASGVDYTQGRADVERQIEEAAARLIAAGAAMEPDESPSP